MKCAGQLDYVRLVQGLFQQDGTNAMHQNSFLAIMTLLIKRQIVSNYLRLFKSYDLNSSDF